jgi:DNA-binding response OmpR family regulator
MPEIVMLVEDEPLLAMDLEGQLRDLAYDVAGPHRSCSEALAWLKEAVPDLAIIDYMLTDGPCDDLLIELAERGVPTVVLSGHLEKNVPPGIAALHLWLEKPVTPSQVTEALAEVRSCRRSVDLDDKGPPSPKESGRAI